MRRDSFDCEVTIRNRFDSIQLFRVQKTGGAYDFRESLETIDNYPQPLRAHSILRLLTFRPTRDKR